MIDRELKNNVQLDVGAMLVKQLEQFSVQARYSACAGLEIN